MSEDRALVDAVVEAFRAEGMTGDPEQIRRFAEAAWKVCERDTERLREAAKWLLTLKDGSRSEAYEWVKSRAWWSLREALAEFGERDG